LKKYEILGFQTVNGVKFVVMKVISIFTKSLFILCIPVFLFTASIGIAVNSAWLYKAGFEKYDIAQVTGISEPELNKAANGLIQYLIPESNTSIYRLLKTASLSPCLTKRKCNTSKMSRD
jgi:hypothetical protein